jgi:hypothetical protein
MTIRSESLFLGKPIDYWFEVDKDLKDRGVQELVSEIATLRAKISYYESRISQLHDFMKINLEVKT